MKVSELMTPDPVAAPPELPIADALEWMAARAVRHVPVVDHDRLVGLVSERDLLEQTGGKRERTLEPDRSPKVLRDAMSVPVLSVTAEDDVRTALDVLLERRLGCLPVVDAAGRLAGMLTVADLLAAQVAASASAPGVGALDELVASCMSAPPVRAGAGTTVAGALALCRRHGVRHLPVESDGWFVGLVSDRDLRLRVGRGETEKRLDEVMSTDLVTLGPESLLSDAAELMRRRRVESVPVTRDGRLVGMLTATDVLRVLRERLPAEAEGPP